MDLVDWELAVSTATRLVGPGPSMTSDDAAAVVRQLRTLAPEALDHVVRYTGLIPDPDLATGTEVVDRGRWAANNVAGMRVTMAPLLDTLATKRAEKIGNAPGAGLVTAVGRKITGAELGAVLAFVGSRVLGQYEVFLPPADGDGRLSLVAPNIVEVERRLGADPRDFRMWVCLHEQTHHVQFTATPWLKPHLQGLIAQLAQHADFDVPAMIGRLRDAIRERPEGGALAIVQSPQQRAVIGEIQSLMTLLEGHADQVMDAVGPEVVPSVAQIRAGFEERRRQTGSPISALLRKVLGFDAKLAQYRVGGKFCRAVTAAGGPAAMRVAFAAPQNVPTKAEFADPTAWLERTSAARL